MHGLASPVLVATRRNAGTEAHNRKLCGLRDRGGTNLATLDCGVIGGGGEQGLDGESKPLKVQFGVPQKYSTITTSGLTGTIPEEGVTNLKIELKSK